MKAGVMSVLGKISWQRRVCTPCPTHILDPESLSREQCGQATTELAILLPALMVVLALLLQPVCLLYTRMIMQHAAVTTSRIAQTASNEAICVAYAQRRLAAVPEVPLFHVGGGQDWNIAVSGVGEAVVDVSIEGHARPLPLFGVLSALAGTSDEAGIVLSAHIHQRVRPLWVEGGYYDWIAPWQ